MHFHRAAVILGTALLLAMGLVEPAYAQSGGTCSSVVETAIEALGNNCAGLGRNSACYGTFRVDATFSDPAAQTAFSAPADQASITTLQTIRTFPLNTSANEWGISVINAQANIPGALPGQNAVFLLIGDAEMENAVPADEAFVPGELLPLQPLIESNLYAAPSIDAEVVAEIPAEAEILADALSEDGEWLRTAHEEQAGWVSRAAFTPEADLSSLPIYTPQSFTPMQAFYFRTSIGSECSAAPDAVVVQGPEHLTIDINANGADIRLGSTILMQTLPLTPEEEQQLREQYGLTGAVGSLFLLVVLDGEAIINPDSDNPIHVPAGYSTVACLSDGQNLGSDGISNDNIVLADCGFTPPTPVTQTEWNNYAALNNLTLNYPIDLDEYLDDTCQPRADWAYTYVVRPGDSLSGIAGFYGVSTQEMAQANCIEDPNTIYAGASLRVPLNVQPPIATLSPTPTAVPPTSVPPTSVPPTAVPPTGVPPTSTLTATATATATPTTTNTPTDTPTATPTETLVPGADLEVTASVDNNMPFEASVIYYTITVTNLGTLDATGVQIGDLLPDGFESLAEDESYNSSDDVWDVGTLLNGDSADITIPAFVPFGSGGQSFSNTPFVISSDQPDSNSGNNAYPLSVIAQSGTQEVSF